METLDCAASCDRRSCHWWDAAAGCRLAREVDLAIVGWSAPVVPAAQARIPVALA